MPGLPPGGHLSHKQHYIPIAVGVEQALDDTGTRPKFAGYHQLGVLVGRDARQPQQDFPGLSMDCTGDVTLPELEDGTYIDNDWRVFFSILAV
jgi:hypothetical protein